MNYDDITIKQYYNLIKANDYETELDKRIAMLAAVNDLTFDEVEEWTVGRINSEAKKYSFLGEPIKTKVQPRWNGYEFTIKLNDLRADQMIDYLELTKNDLTFELHSLLAILDVSKKDFAEKQKHILETCPITIAQGVSNFFLHKYSLSTKVIQNYSLSKMKELERLTKMNQELLRAELS